MIPLREYVRSRAIHSTPMLKPTSRRFFCKMTRFIIVIVVVIYTAGVIISAVAIIVTATVIVPAVAVIVLAVDVCFPDVVVIVPNSTVVNTIIVKSMNLLITKEKP